MSKAPESPLYDTEAEASQRAVIVGETVHRATGYWTPAVHDLLRHLHATTFASYVPRVLGFDDRGREVLSYIAGASGADSWEHIVADRGLRYYARFVRAYHDAVASFVSMSNAVWALESRPPADGEIICHGDFGPWNVVWNDSTPVGLIDWDDAGPGPAMTDIACAIEHAAPFRDDEECVRWRRYPTPPDRRRRIEVFAEAYGLPTARGMVDEVIRAQYADLDRVRRLAEQGMPRPARWVARGFLGELRARISWSEQHRYLLE